jgi:hypothetical protein
LDETTFQPVAPAVEKQLAPCRCAQDALQQRSSEEGAGGWPLNPNPASPTLQRVPLPAPHAAAAEQQRARRQQQAGPALTPAALNPAALNPTAPEPSPKPFGSLLSEAQLERISAESMALQGGDPAAAGSAAAGHADANAAAFPYAPLPPPPQQQQQQQQQEEEGVQVRVSAVPLGLTSWSNASHSCISLVSSALAGSNLVLAHLV